MHWLVGGKEAGVLTKTGIGGQGALRDAGALEQGKKLGPKGREKHRVFSSDRTAQRERQC